MGEKVIQVKCKQLSVPKYLTLIGALKIKNGCCKDEPVLITGCIGTDNKEIYSLQCSCGCWCTNGFGTIAEAINDWIRMSKKPYWRDKDGEGLDTATQINT